MLVLQRLVRPRRLVSSRPFSSLHFHSLDFPPRLAGGRLAGGLSSEVPRSRFPSHLGQRGTSSIETLGHWHAPPLTLAWVQDRVWLFPFSFGLPFVLGRNRITPSASAWVAPPPPILEISYSTIGSKDPSIAIFSDRHRYLLPPPVVPPGDRPRIR